MEKYQHVPAYIVSAIPANPYGVCRLLLRIVQGVFGSSKSSNALSFHADDRIVFVFPSVSRISVHIFSFCSLRSARFD